MQNYFLSSHLNWLIESVSSFLFSISSVEMKWYRSQAAHTLAPFLLSPEVSDSCRFFGPSLPPGCLTVLCCHGNRGSEASSCDWYAAEVFPNLTPWLPLPILLPPVCCCLSPPPPPLFLSDVLSGSLSWWVQPMCLCPYPSAQGCHSALPCWLIVLVDISRNWGCDMKYVRWEGSFGSDRTTQNLRLTAAKKKKKETQKHTGGVGRCRHAGEAMLLKVNP